MKKNIFIILLLTTGLAACDRNDDVAAIEATVDNVAEALAETVETPIAVEEESTSTNTSEGEESLITPGDLPEEEQAAMYQQIAEYNKCMMSSRLKVTQGILAKPLGTLEDGNKPLQSFGNRVMAECEPQMDELEAYLLSKNVNEALVMGMTKKMRSRAARQFMTQGMNQMAAQAQALENAEQMKAAE